VARTNPAFMSGIPELFILELLSAQEMYGYQIVEAIKLRTREAISLREGVVYPVLHGLQRSGKLRTRKMKVSGRERIYYQTTAKGSKRLEELQDEWRRVSSRVELMMKPHATS